jgi:FtsH-binding integral membrane protein
MLPFSREQFMAVFAAYNEAVWPAQWLLMAAAVACLLLVRAGTLRASRAACAILAFFWAWMAVAYHWAHFARINGAAHLFAAFSLAAAALFAWAGIRGRVRFSLASHTAPWGLLLVVLALAGYPIASHLVGHHYPETPTFGLPCPTTIFTLGMLLFSVAPVPRAVLAVPLLWAAVGTTGAFTLAMYEDFALLFAGLLALLLQLKDPGEEVDGLRTRG